MNDSHSHRVAEATEELFFDACLSPHRSLSRRGFLVLMCAVGTVSFGVGLTFFLIGAWPVIGFMGLDVALLYVAFEMNYRHGRMYETLRLTRGDLVVERVNHWGERTTWRFQPYWLQVLMDEPLRIDSDLTLRSHGQSLSIGRFLTPSERLDLARALRAALHQARTVGARA